MPRSGFCSPCEGPIPGATHDRCRLTGCSCVVHDADLLAKSAELTEAPAEPRPLWDAVAEVAFAALHVTKEATSLSELPPEEAMRILYGLRDAIDHLRDVDAALVQHIYLHGEHGDVRLEGLPPAKVTRGRDRKDWDARGAAFAYVDSKMVERHGETPDPAEVASWVLEVVGASYCRVTPLRAVGLDPEAFCESSPGRLSVTFTD